MNDTNKHRVASEADLLDDAGIVVTVEHTPIALFRVEGRCYAISNACPHRGGPLGDGDVEGHLVHCPWHGLAWDLRTGANPRQPDSKVACYPVSVENGEVFVELDAGTGTAG